MRKLLLGLAALLFPLIMVACGELPTASHAPEVRGEQPRLSCYWLADGSVRCTPISPDWGDDTCDPYHYDCGGDDCIQSSGVGGLEGSTVQGCDGGGGTIGDGDEDTVGGGVGGGGGGGTTSPKCPDYDYECLNDPPDEECDPTLDPDCEQPLTAADTAMIRLALRNYLRAPSAIPDTTARRQCEEMRRQFEASLAAGRVFRGGSNSTGDDAHYGATYRQRIHFDPWLLDGANNGNLDDRREVVNTALHEAAHTLNKHHYTEPSWVGGYDVYTEPYFNLLSPGPNTCVVY